MKITSRLKALEQNDRQSDHCLVEDETGMTREVPLDTWFEHRDKWNFLRLTPGTALAHLIDLIYADIDAYCV